jgi:ABC-type multidrug transport system fused ATPase/permease subunit
MPPMQPGRGPIKGTAKLKNPKETIKKLVQYYKSYKLMFIVAVVIALIGGAATVAGVLLSGFLYDIFLIPNFMPDADPALFDLISFI